MRLLMEATLMTRPQRRATIPGSIALPSRYGAVRFTASVRSQKASSYSSSGRGSALLPMPEREMIVAIPSAHAL
jgi:hypothetical protein